MPIITIMKSAATVRVVMSVDTTLPIGSTSLSMPLASALLVLLVV